MTSVLVVHDVDDVDHWVSSPKRAEIFSPLGITIKTYVDPDGSNTVGLAMEIPDMDTFKAVLDSEAGAEAMKFDGVHPDTIRMFVSSG